MSLRALPYSPLALTQFDFINISTRSNQAFINLFVHQYSPVHMENIHLAADDPRHGKVAHLLGSGSPVQKRNRIQLSCSSCRQGKLKCDRQQPCLQCVRKGKSSQCSFSNQVQKPVVSLKNRLKHLESLVKDAMIAQNLAVTQGAVCNSPNSLNGSNSVSRDYMYSPLSLHGQDQSNVPLIPAPGQVLLSTGPTYVGATHWAAILEDVSITSL